MSSGRVRTLAVVALLSAAPGLRPVRAQLTNQLGILDLNANGGINPATGNPWQAGDKYRFAFTSSGVTPATSTNIATYNDFVRGLADASHLNIGDDDGASWKAIASTEVVDARDNTSTHIAVNGPGEAIFLLDGKTVVATNYAALWGDQTHNSAINKTEALGTPPKVFTYGDTWTGTQRYAYPNASYGTKDTTGDGPLGDPDGDAMGGIWPFTSGTHWIWRWGRPTSTELPLYALSDPLEVREPVTAVGTVLVVR